MHAHVPLRTALALPIALVLVAPAAAADEAAPACPATDEHVIAVDGRGKIDARPDAMRARVGVEVQAKKPADAQAAASRAASKIVAAVRAIEVPGLTIRTEDLSLSPVHSTVTSGSAPPAIVGYRARNVVEVKAPASPDAVGSLAGKILQAAEEAGATEIGAVDTYVLDQHEAEARALASAVADAERRAQAIAKEADVTIVALDGIEVGGIASPIPRGVRAMAAVAEADVAPPVEAGERTIEARVTARFRFDPKR